MEQRQDKSQI